MGLLEKAQQRKQEILEKPRDSEVSILKEIAEEIKPKEIAYSKMRTKKEKQKYIADEKSGFGWKGLGSRRIVFDQSINEYKYEVSEPVLDEDELKTKNELVRLFKMLADINVFDIDKEEKKKIFRRNIEPDNNR